MSDANPQSHHSSTAHSRVQKSTTLNRRYVRRPRPYAKSDTASSQTEPCDAAVEQITNTTQEQQNPNCESDFISRFVNAAHASVSTSNKVVQSDSADQTPSTALSNNCTQAKTEVADAQDTQSAPDTNADDTTRTLPPRASRYRRSESSIQASINAPSAQDFHQNINHEQQIYSEKTAQTDIAASANPAAPASITIPTDQTAETNQAAPASAELAQNQSSVTHLTQEAPSANGQALANAIHAISTNDNENVKDTEKSTSKTTKVKRSGNAKRFIIAFSSACACVAALAFFIHLNMPDVSLKVAAMQTGIEASYPSYTPRDFQMTSVYTEDEGKVVIEFNGPNNHKYTVTEEKTTWDTQALLKNYVEPELGEEYSSIREQGITIYISGSNAAWVNGGIFYHIDANPKTLTKKQIKNIAVSF